MTVKLPSVPCQGGPAIAIGPARSGATPAPRQLKAELDASGARPMIHLFHRTLARNVMKDNEGMIFGSKANSVWLLMREIRDV
jgi:hypothetical protein